MTAQRQEIKGRWPELARIAAVCGLAAGLCGGPVALAATTERLVVDRVTGLALGGTDPVAYFTDAGMLAGRADIELTAEGAVWRFRNEDNRAFFLAAPEIYAPQFGGYDPVDVARGVAVVGRPRLWLIHDQRLYLFSREESRDAFAAGPGPILRAAVTGWSGLRETLAQ
nr:YHS domain-containing (seleno)protein [Bradyrhizobium prioritasuperba]